MLNQADLVSLDAVLLKSTEDLSPRENVPDVKFEFGAACVQIRHACTDKADVQILYIFNFDNMVPVVQIIVSLTTSLRGQLVKYIPIT